MFSTQQVQYFVEKLGQATADAFIAAAKAGAHGALRALVEPNLDQGDWQAIEAFIARAKPQATGFAGVSSSSPAAAPLVGLGTFAQAISDTLSRKDKAGNVIRKHPGIAKPYLDGKAVWPTVGPFGTPFPTLEQIASMKREAMAAHVTSSGYPKQSVDGMLYYQRPEATDTTQKPEEQATLFYAEGDRIQAFGWRGYNMGQGKAAKYWLPSRHEARCIAMGVQPVQAKALLASAQQAVTAPPAQPAVKRTRRKAQAQA